MENLFHVPGVAGVDEAGRGPLAGPVVIAAVVIPDGFDLTGIADSKKLSRSQRDTQAARIKEYCAVSLVIVSAERIDDGNILEATLWGMGKALNDLVPTPKAALIDGNQPPTGTLVGSQCVVKGDNTYACIAAASIVAKTTRDRLMVAYASEFPGYGFEHHFGYPTAEHLAALDELGPCPIHRRSFAPVRDRLLQPCLALAE